MDYIEVYYTYSNYTLKKLIWKYLPVGFGSGAKLTGKPPNEVVFVPDFNTSSTEQKYFRQINLG